MRDLIERRIQQICEEDTWSWEPRLRELIRPDTVDAFMKVCPVKFAEDLKTAAREGSLLFWVFLASTGAQVELPLGARAVRQWLQGQWRTTGELQDPLPFEPEPLRALLSSREPLVRASAAAALGQLKQGALPAAEDLAARLKDEDAQVRRWACWALEAIRPPAPSVTEALRTALASALLEERLWLTWALVRLGVSDEQLADWDIHDTPLPSLALPPNTVESLVPALAHPEPSFRREAARLFALLGKAARPAAPALLRAVDDEDTGVRYGALKTLATVGSEFPPSLPKALSLVKPEVSDSIRLAALKVCGSFGMQALPTLVEALGDARLRDTAAQAIGAIGPPAASGALDALISSLDDRAQDVAEALGNLGPSALSAAEPLARLAVHGGDSMARRAAARALRALGAFDVAERAAHELTAQMKADPPPSSTSTVTRGHFYVLAELGEAAVPALLPLLEDGNPALVDEALSAFEAMGPGVREPWILPLLESPDVGVRHRAISTLGRLDARSDAALEALVFRLEADPFWTVRHAAARALLTLRGALRGRAQRAVDALTRALSEEEPPLRWDAATALGAIGHGTPAAREALRRMLREDRASLLARGHGMRSLRERAAWALGELGAEPETLQSLTEALSDEDAHVRCSAALALGRLGPAASTSAEALQRLESHATDEELREALRWALARLGGARRLPTPAAMRLVSEALQQARPLSAMPWLWR